METKPSILYVDDEENNLFSFKAAFRRKYQVHTVLSGEEGLEALKEKEFCLVISDQQMPGMTGVEFLEQVSNHYPGVMTMILTGFSDVEAIIGAINKGNIFRYITKPWDERELQISIENALKLFNLRKNNQQLVSELEVKVKEQQKTLDLFRKYVPAEVVDQVLENDEESIFEGELRKVAMLMCDIRGFTAMSERWGPRDVVTFLNDYYALMTEAIKNHGGTVQQFVGDEVVGAFGAPVELENCSQNAVYCAIEMMGKLDQLNEKYRSVFGHDVKMGIGIHFGEVVAGNAGSEDFISYCVTGKTVNKARDLEGLTKELGNSILISEEVRRHINSDFDLEELALSNGASPQTEHEIFQLKGGWTNN